MKDLDKLINDAKLLPSGKELGVINRYKVLIRCIKGIESLKFWQVKQKQFYREVINRALTHF